MSHCCKIWQVQKKSKDVFERKTWQSNTESAAKIHNFFGHFYTRKGKTKLPMEAMKDGQDSEKSKEWFGQVMWQIGAAWATQNILVWLIIVKKGNPWQPTYYQEDGTHSHRAIFGRLTINKTDMCTNKLNIK